ncbi:ABC transporter ATP-binding protein [Candidatus Sumerlaeota bacterium]|nr:ABC transporter ATP-binding protein [Candidatus Sumerlaeota bacterium]
MSQAQTQQPTIVCEDIRKEYRMGDEIVRALDGISLTIQSGEMVAIIGQSGSGKSTLMNVLGCLDTPTSGKYILDGRDVSRLNDNQLAEVRNRKIGFVFQTFNLLARTTALENVEVPLFYRGERNARKLAREALDRVGLGGRMGHMPNQLSGGQRQRVAIARALVINPAIVLADEPTGNLDSATGEEIMGLFRNLHEEGATIIIVTHEPDIAAYCPRHIAIRDGKILHDRQVPDAERRQVAAKSAAS